MSILSLDYFVFIFVVLVLFYLVPDKYRWIVLLSSSIYFYIEKTPSYQWASFAAFILINYVASLFIIPENKSRKIIFTGIIIFDILFFICLKYPKFVFLSIVYIYQCAGREFNNLAFQNIVNFNQELCPSHISYFGLIVIGYICDVYWEKVKVQKDPAKFLLFSSFFPIIVSGPIVTYKNMENELFIKQHRFSYDKIVSGIERIIFGAFKKLVVAERAAVIVNTIYNNYESYNGLYIPFAALMFVAQLYADFSGLMDIVLGVAELFDINLSENFDLPFTSLTLSEFWRRWHITLGEWLKDYILFPIYRSKSFRKLDKWCKTKWGKKYAKKFNLPSYLALLISWFIIGLWHGGGWNYIFGVGIYMWFIIVMSDICKGLFAKFSELLHINTQCFSFKLFQRIRTLLIYSFGLSFFRAETLQSGFEMWKSALNEFNPWIFVDKSLLDLGLDRIEWEIFFIGILIIIAVSIIKQVKGSVRETLNRQNFVFRLMVYLLLFIITVIWGYYGAGFDAESFIYGRF